MSNEGNDIKFTRREFVRTPSAQEFARAAVLDGFTGGRIYAPRSRVALTPAGAAAGQPWQSGAPVLMLQFH